MHVLPARDRAFLYVLGRPGHDRQRTVTAGQIAWTRPGQDQAALVMASGVPPANGIRTGTPIVRLTRDLSSVRYGKEKIMQRRLPKTALALALLLAAAGS